MHSSIAFICSGDAAECTPCTHLLQYETMIAPIFHQSSTRYKCARSAFTLPQTRCTREISCLRKSSVSWMDGDSSDQAAFQINIVTEFYVILGNVARSQDYRASRAWPYTKVTHCAYRAHCRPAATGRYLPTLTQNNTIKVQANM